MPFACPSSSRPTSWGARPPRETAAPQRQDAAAPVVAPSSSPFAYRGPPVVDGAPPAAAPPAPFERARWDRAAGDLLLARKAKHDTKRALREVHIESAKAGVAALAGAVVSGCRAGVAAFRREHGAPERFYEPYAPPQGRFKAARTAAKEALRALKDDVRVQVGAVRSVHTARCTILKIDIATHRRVIQDSEATLAALST